MANKPLFLKYELDTELLLGRNLPPEYAKPKIIELIYAWLGGIRALFTTLKTTQSDIKEYLKYNSQTIVLEALLNEKFDSSLGRIRIQDFKYKVKYYASGGQSNARVGRYEAIQNKTSSVGYFGNSVAFVTVYVPPELASSQNEIFEIIKDFVFFGTQTIRI
jgi:hypothetical protein